MDSKELEDLINNRLDALQKSYALPSKPRCGARYFFRSDIATIDSYLADLAGNEVFNVMVDSWLKQLVFTLRPGANEVTYTLPLNWFEARKQHDFPNTGAQRSWCNHCGAVAHFNWRSGMFEAA